MHMEYDAAAAGLTVQLGGEIDHHCAALLRSEIDAALYAHTPKLLILDFSNVFSRMS